MRPHVPPDLRAVGDAAASSTSASSSSSYSRVRAHDRRNAGARKVAEDDAAVRLEPGVPPLPERRARGQAQHVRQQVARDVHRVDEELLILDADVDVRAEDQQLLREILQVLPSRPRSARAA